MPPVMAAIKDGDIETLRALLDAGHSPDEPQRYLWKCGNMDREGEAAPLELAVIEGRKDMAELLIQPRGGYFALRRRAAVRLAARRAVRSGQAVAFDVRLPDRRGGRESARSRTPCRGFSHIWKIITQRGRSAASRQARHELWKNSAAKPLRAMAAPPGTGRWRNICSPTART